MPTAQTITFEEFKGLRVAYLRDRGPAEQVSPPLMRKLRGVAVQHKLHGPDAIFLSIINDDPRSTEHGHVRVDAAVSVTADFLPPKESGFAVRELLGGPHAVYRHVGSKKSLRDAWANMISLPMPGYRLRSDAPSFEIHRNDPAHTPEGELITDLYQPVEPIR